MMRALLPVGNGCNNGCVFCAQDSPVVRTQAAPDVQGLAQRLAQLEGTTEGVTITGGEPTLRDDLRDVVALARSRGFARIGLQTNAAALGTERLDELAAAGLTDVQLSLHGATAAVHDYHTGTAGSFERVVDAMGSAKRRGLAVAVVTVLTRSNCRVLSPLADVLTQHKVDGWCLWIPHARGAAERSFHRMVPRLGLALPFALHAMRRASARAVPAFIAGAPLCALGPLASHAIPTAPRSFHPRCDVCPSRTRCPGVDAHYLTRFDGDELRAVDAPAADDAHADVRGLFVGPGQLSPASDLDIPAPPRVARHALPVLGKSRPAVAEARRGAQQTGEALGALFPALFEEGDG